MNFQIVLRQLGRLTIVVSITVLLVCLWSFAQLLTGDESERACVKALATTSAAGIAVGIALSLGTRRGNATIGRRDALLLVATSWFLAAAIAAMPYRLWASLEHQAPTDAQLSNFVGCYFEAMSGLTTTGATVLSDVESLPRSLHLWRALTHWLGGLGIVVLFVAVLPMLGVGGKHLFRAESTGPSPDGITPRIQETARALWMIYLGLTLLEILALCACGMSLFDSVCHTFSTLATGGFGTRNASVAGFDSLAVDTVIVVFMIAAGVNFSLYYQLLRGRWRDVGKDPELRLYLAIIAIGALIVSASIYNRPVVTTAGKELTAGALDAIRYGAFQTVSVQTCTGFCTADFDRWGFGAKAVMLTLMCVGGSAGSTSGGIKVIRVLIAAKIIWNQLECDFRPNVIRTLRVGHTAVDGDQKISILVFILAVACVTVLGAAGLMLTESHTQIDPTTALTAIVTTFNNVGPGLARVGAMCNFGWFSDSGKLIICAVMALGRLEVFTLLVLFSPRFWQSR